LVGFLYACMKGGGRERLLVLGFLIGYLFMAGAKVRWAYYSITFLPFVYIFLALGIHSLVRWSGAKNWKPALILTFLYVLCYVISYAKLYWQKNTRDLAIQYIIETF